MEAPIFNVKSPKGMAAVLMISTFVGLFGETALNMALTNIMDDFGVSAASAAWLTTGYLLVLAVLVPLSSYLVRWFTTRQLVVAAVVFAVIGSLLGALAPNFAVLLAGRFVQALATGIILPLMFSVVMLIFPVQKRGAVMGIVGIILTAGPALGPSIAGLIVSSLSWRYIFWIMVVVYAVVIVLALSKVDNVSNVTRPKIDLLSLITSTFGFGGVVFALATLAEQSITKPIVWVPLVVGFVLLVVFGIRQTKMDEPMIDLSVFKSPMFSLGVALMVATMFMILSVAILVPMFLKTVLGFAALTAGLCMLPGNILNIIMSPIVGTNFDKVGAKIFTRIGFTLILVSMIVFLTTISATTATWIIIVNLCVFFVGVSMTIMPAQTNAMNSLAPHKFADGSAALNTLTQIAGASGTAVAITMFTIGQQNYIEKFNNALPAEFLAHGVHSAFIVVTVVAVLGLVGSFFVKNSKQVGN
ncbi:High-copy suppressor of rspA [Solibacillus isronensis B3W22]|uniref:High-copy suppressor of rspA n=1 Tax=Solibacillus isronensis B3W22 TaxID=1224748 RepID=K1LKK9_9BACL|nr:DHA2 family efflux MFS transporter permease subunit [Solibacillus isronensis]AMO86791.1 multidrug MFS transporter [Solibacillus silvestris]EKB44844.1 High-copy suppressor of rspA [Solibacillus isronensis B3W22]